MNTVSATMAHFNKRFISRFIAFVGVVVLSGCADSGTVIPGVPSCVASKADELRSEPLRNPPAEIWEWKTATRTYYYIPPYCCDQFSYLLDEECNVVCSPDGGITGMGSGNCPDLDNGIEKKLVWRDERN